MTIYLYARNLIEPKYQVLIKKTREDVGIKHLNDPKAFIEYSNTMVDVYNNIDDYKPNINRKNLIVFENMITDIMINKKFQGMIKELFVRCRKLNISLVFITQPYFLVPKAVRLSSIHYLIMKVLNKRELKILIIQQTLIIKALWRFIKNVQANYFLFWLLILHYQLIVDYVFEKNF